MKQSTRTSEKEAAGTPPKLRGKYIGLGIKVHKVRRGGVLKYTKYAHHLVCQVQVSIYTKLRSLLRQYMGKLHEKHMMKNNNLKLNLIKVKLLLINFSEIEFHLILISGKLYPSPLSMRTIEFNVTETAQRSQLSETKSTDFQWHTLLALASFLI